MNLWKNYVGFMFIYFHSRDQKMQKKVLQFFFYPFWTSLFFYLFIGGELTGQRLAVVERAWGNIDQYNQSRVSLSDLCKRFNPLADTKVKNGDLTPAHAVQKFMSTFDFGDTKKGDGGLVTKSDFIEYYTSVSPTIDEDNVFSLMVWNSWLSLRRWFVTKNDNVFLFGEIIILKN
jgi:hypothetical protein